MQSTARAPRPASSHRSLRPRLGILAGLAAVALLGACNSGSGGSTGELVVGGEYDKPGESGTFFVDPNEGGDASRLLMEGMFWGRLVDVHDIDDEGEPNPLALFRDLVINENIQSDLTNYQLDTNPITQRTRLIIQRTKGAPAVSGFTFDDLLRQARSNLPSITPKNDDGTDPPPFSFLTRNCTLVVRFNDLLDDGLEAEIDLPQTVKVFTDYPPLVPFTPRLTFDRNYGGIAGGRFHTTRLLIDMTVSEAEAANMPVAAPINSLGLPASIPTKDDANVGVRIPTATDVGSGQFVLLEGLHGATVSFEANGPRDDSSPTKDIVRAMRSGNDEDLNNGFLLDLNTPRVLGGWPIDLDGIHSLDASTGHLEGFDFLVTSATFQSLCQTNPQPGDIFSINGNFLEVFVSGTLAESEVKDVYVHVLTDEPVTNPNLLLGGGLYLSAYDPAVQVDSGCWITFAPQPGTYPASRIWPTAQILVRFSEPMDPTTVLPFDTMLTVRGDVNTAPTATSVVIGSVSPSSDLKEFAYSPLLPFAHTGQQDIYHIDIVGGPDGITDLAGNPLAFDLPKIQFDIHEDAPLEANGGIVMRFNDVDELEPVGTDTPIYDLRGQFFYDLENGLVRPRPVQYVAAPADRTNPVPSIMIPFPPGVQTPLSALGSKLQTVWRYCDLGWNVYDETKYNMDVIGLNWSPIGGQIIGDYFEQFEIRLSHSYRIPDEWLDPNLLPEYPGSGLVGSPAFYTDNILSDPLDPQKVVHNRALGYVVNPVDLFLSTTGTFLMPFPLNRGGTSAVKTWTWRNTAVLAKGGPSGAGIPLRVEADNPLALYGDPANSPWGDAAPPNQVPSYGLPILLEYRCFPSDSGLGLNASDISLAINSSARPNFRAFSTGGIDTGNNVVTKNPDLELVPSGGFNPSSTPPGRPTAFDADNAFYVGQLDAVIRVSRIHTIWIDALLGSPNYMSPVVEPAPANQSPGTQIIIEYRGAENIFNYTGDTPFDANKHNPYGEPYSAAPEDFWQVLYLNGNRTWLNDIQEIDGARYLQMRFSFFNNIDSGLSPVLSAVGIAFENE